MNRPTLFDLYSTDIQSLSPQEWHDLRRRLVREAHDEQARAVRAGFAWLVSWIRSRRAGSVTPSAIGLVVRQRGA